jgi:bile acid-coenzyme A ligase
VIERYRITNFTATPTTMEFVDEIPRTAATKINRSAMIEARGG